ncbi:MAG: prepilin peptidase [Agromyces sp.]
MMAPEFDVAVLGPVLELLIAAVLFWPVQWLSRRYQRSAGTSVARARAEAAATFLGLWLMSALGLAAFDAGLPLSAWLAFSAVAVAAVRIDLREHRLPNPLTLLAFVCVAVLLLLAAVLSGDWARLASAGACSAASGVTFLLLAFIAPRGLGMGDVKFSLSVGLILGWLGPAVAVAGFLVAFISAAVGGIAVIVLRRGSLKSQLAFGPAMVLGSIVALALSATG